MKKVEKSKNLQKLMGTVLLDSYLDQRFIRRNEEKDDTL